MKKIFKICETWWEEQKDEGKDKHTNMKKGWGAAR